MKNNNLIKLALYGMVFFLLEGALYGNDVAYNKYLNGFSPGVVLTEEYPICWFSPLAYYVEDQDGLVFINKVKRDQQGRVLEYTAFYKKGDYNEGVTSQIFRTEYNEDNQPISYEEVRSYNNSGERYLIEVWNVQYWHDMVINFSANIVHDSDSLIVPPVISEIADDTAQEGVPYTGPTPTLIRGTPQVFYSLVKAPAGIFMDFQTGIVSWDSPVPADDPYTITIRARNHAGKDEESWKLTVAAEPEAPVLPDLLDDTALAGAPYTGPVITLESGTEPVSYSLVMAPSGMTIDEGGILHWANPTTGGSAETNWRLYSEPVGLSKEGVGESAYPDGDGWFYDVPAGMEVTKASFKQGKSAGTDTIDITAKLLNIPSQDKIGEVNKIYFRAGPSYFIINTDNPNLETSSTKTKFKGQADAGDAGDLNIQFDRKKGVLRFKASNTDLTSMGDPVALVFAAGNYIAASITYGASYKPSAACFRQDFADVFRLMKYTLKSGNKANSDSLTLEGDIAFEDASVNLSNQPLYLQWGNYRIEIPAGSFLLKKGKYTAKKVSVGGSATVDATIDLNKCTYKFTIKKADTGAQPDPIRFRLLFNNFDQSVWIEE